VALRDASEHNPSMARLRRLAAPLTAVGSALVNAVGTIRANAAARRLECDRLRAENAELAREAALLREEIRIKDAVLARLPDEEPPR
jgi:cell division protein FtsB